MITPEERAIAIKVLGELRTQIQGIRDKHTNGFIAQACDARLTEIRNILYMLETETTQS